jgi:putative ABC transport system ATP-binding protein
MIKIIRAIAEEAEDSICSNTQHAGNERLGLVWPPIPPQGAIMILIRAERLVKTYRTGEVEVAAVKGVDFTIEAKSFVAFVGPSGSGKSTLLNMIGCLDHPTSGKLAVMNTDVGKLDRRAAAHFRGEHIGFVFQDFNLIPVLTVYENIEYPLIMVQNWLEQKRRAQIMRLLDAVGMAGQANKRPDQISGGQKQRVAVARALVTNAQLVLADEPTANLDHDTAYQIIELMKRMRDDLGTTFVFSTHDPKIMAEAETLFMLEDGRLHVPSVAAKTEAVHA